MVVDAIYLLASWQVCSDFGHPTSKQDGYRTATLLVADASTVVGSHHSIVADVDDTVGAVSSLVLAFQSCSLALRAVRSADIRSILASCSFLAQR